MSEHCPTLGGLSEDGFNPEFDLKQIVLSPSDSMHIWGWLTSALLVLITVTIASHTINEHLHHYHTPEIQRHKVRVVAYPAAYSILAWLSYLKYDYETVILFFARLFESFAVYNLYMCLQSYLQPFRIRNEGMKESVSTKVFGLYTFKLKSKWGLHYRVITDILVLQFPIWNIIAAFISMFTQLKGVYCDGQFDFHGAYIYLATIQFISLSIILTALFTYLAVYNEEWKEGHIRAHGMFWCVKAPIMIIFYCGDILLMVLSYFKVIKDKPAATPSGTYWTAAAIKNGYYVLIICVCMTVVAILMQIYFGLDEKELEMDDDEDPDYGYWEALVDGFLAYIPQFLKNVFLCGGDTVVLAKKRRHLKRNNGIGGGSGKRRLSEDELNLLAADEDNQHLNLHDTTQSLHEYLTQPLPALYNKKLDDIESGRDGSNKYFIASPTTAMGTSYASYNVNPNYNALPMQPLSSSIYPNEKDGDPDDNIFELYGTPPQRDHTAEQEEITTDERKRTTTTPTTTTAATTAKTFPLPNSVAASSPDNRTNHTEPVVTNSSIQESEGGVRQNEQQFEQYPMITIPPAPLQSRVINHNDEFTSAAQQHTTHFTPHDLERK